MKRISISLRYVLNDYFKKKRTNSYKSIALTYRTDCVPCADRVVGFRGKRVRNALFNFFSPNGTLRSVDGGITYHDVAISYTRDREIRIAYTRPTIINGRPRTTISLVLVDVVSCFAVTAERPTMCSGDTDDGVFARLPLLPPARARRTKH